MQVAFESLDAPQLHLASQPMLSLHASGRITGIVFESGHSITQTASIFEGFVMPGVCKSIPYGGEVLD